MTDERQNVAETVRDIMQDHGDPMVLHEELHARPDCLMLVARPTGVTIEDHTRDARDAAEWLKPFRRRGTDTLTSLDALILWAGRFCTVREGDDGPEDISPTGVVFADTGDGKFAPVMTCIANWHKAGAADPDGKDDTAMRGDHRAVYRFPVSEEWQRWSKIAEGALSKDEMGEFIEDNAKDILDPTPALLGIGDPTEEWEQGMVDVSQKVDGRFASYRQLLEMSRKFAATEATKFKLHSNRDTGEHLIEAESEHRDEDGAPIRVPNLFMIAIPVFDRGPLYRIAVRLRYRLRGGLSFSISMYAPDVVARHAFDEAVETVRTDTQLPIIMGRP